MSLEFAKLFRDFRRKGRPKEKEEGPKACAVLKTKHKQKNIFKLQSCFSRKRGWALLESLMTAGFVFRDLLSTFERKV